MIKVLIATATIFLFIHSLTAQETCTRHSEPTGAFSICIPAGWTAETRENNQFKILLAPRATDFTPNINFRFDTLPPQYSLASYVDGSVKAVIASTDKLGATKITFAGQTDFVTARTMKGIRSQFVSEYKGRTIRSSQYFFLGKDKKKILIVTATSLDSDSSSTNSIFDDAVKSLRLDE